MKILFWIVNTFKQHFDCFDPQLKTASPTKISMPFMSFLDKLLYKIHVFFFKKVLIILN